MSEMSRKPYRHKIQLDLLTKYRELFRINCLHDFFANGMMANLELHPSQHTEDILRQYNLIFRHETASNYVVGYSIDQSGGSMIDYIDKPLHMTFFVSIPDVFFLNYTELPFKFDDVVYHFNNLELSKEEMESGNLSKFKYVGEEDQLKIVGGVFDYTFAEPADFIEVQVINEIDEVVFEEMVEDAAKCSINLSHEPPGKYILLIDGLEEMEFYLYPHTLKKMFGVIDIFIDKDDISEYSLFDEETKLQKQTYYLHFKNRSTRWKYIFVENSSERLHSDHEIEDSNKGKVTFKGELMTFEEPQEVRLQTGGQAIALTSSKPIPFVENQLASFKLKTKKGKGRMSWLVDLPYPSEKNMLKPDENSEQDDAFLSEIIVYL